MYKNKNLLITFCQFILHLTHTSLKVNSGELLFSYSPHLIQNGRPVSFIKILMTLVKMLLLRSLRPLSVSPSLRALSTVAERKEFVDPEWENARPYEEIPKQSFLSREFLPGGKLFNAPFDDIFNYMREKHGNIVRVPGVFKRPELVVTWNPDDYQKMYRHEGAWPDRLGLASMSYYRKVKRPDIFGKFRGLVDE